MTTPTRAPTGSRAEHAPLESANEPDYQPAARLRAALRRFAAFTEHAARTHGLTPRTYELLLFIQAAADDTDSPATITSLREPLQTTQGSVTQLVERTVRSGLLTRTTDPQDGRSSHLHLTPTGKQRLRRVFDELGPERDRLADVIDQHF